MQCPCGGNVTESSHERVSGAQVETRGCAACGREERRIRWHESDTGWQAPAVAEDMLQAETEHDD